MGVISSKLHLKVKYLSEGQVGELVKNQAMVRQCMVTAIIHQSEGETSAMLERAL